MPIPMLLFIYGDDTFRVQEKVQVMKRAFTEKFDPTGLNTCTFSGKLVPGDIIQAARSLPFMGEKRMVIIRDLIDSTKKGDISVWLDGLQAVPESTIVIFWETAEPKKLEKKPLFKSFQDASEVHHYAFPRLESVQLSRWVAERVALRGGHIERDAQRQLVERVGPDLWQMDQEIGKLVGYAQDKVISSDMVHELVQASFEGKIFGLIEAVSQRRTKDGLRLLQQERWGGANDHYLLTMLGRQVRILVGARALLDINPHASKEELAATMGVHSFVASKALAQARKFSLEVLKKVHARLFEFDRMLKSGLIESDVAVDLTTVSLMND